MEITITLDTVPRGKGRPRVLKTGRTYTPKETKEHEEIILNAYREQCPDNPGFMDGEPLSMRVDIRMPIPKSFTKEQKNKARKGLIKPAKKPDVDNILKIICDALNEAAYKDDAQITRIYADKTYSDTPGYTITINEIKEN